MGNEKWETGNGKRKRVTPTNYIDLPNARCERGIVSSARPGNERTCTYKHRKQLIH